MAFSMAFSEECPPDPELLFLDILAVMLEENEMADISGGDVKIVVVLDKDYSGTAKVTVTPRYDNGKLAVIESTTFTVAVHNRVTGTAVADKGRNDFYITSQFPEGTHTITGLSKAAAGYGNSLGEWITTDATRLVQASATSQGSQLTGSVYQRPDGGYFWHNNDNRAFESSKSYGCLISTKAAIDKVAAILKADKNPKSVKTITVVQPREPVQDRIAPVAAAPSSAESRFIIHLPQ